MTQPSPLDLPVSRPRKAGRVTETSVLAALEVDRHSRASRTVRWLARLTILAPTSLELATEVWHTRPPCFVGDKTSVILEVRRGLSDALALRLVEHAGSRKCSITGRTCLTWRVRGR